MYIRSAPPASGNLPGTRPIFFIAPVVRYLTDPVGQCGRVALCKSGRRYSLPDETSTVERAGCPRAFRLTVLEKLNIA